MCGVQGRWALAQKEESPFPGCPEASQICSLNCRSFVARTSVMVPVFSLLSRGQLRAVSFVSEDVFM